MAIAKIKMPGTPVPPKPPQFPKASKEKMVATAAVASALFRSFSWNDTQEGGDFWESVWSRLNQIAIDGVLKESE